MSAAMLAYNFILALISPLFAVYFLYRILLSGKSRTSWRHQLGLLPRLPSKTPGRPRIWVQAVSVGETVASVPVFKALRELLPDAELVLSTTTITGHGMAKKSVTEADHIVYFPLDFLPCVGRAIKSVDPDVFVSMESEIWPNFLHAARRHGVRTAIINGIVSDKTVNRSGNFRWLYRWALSNVDTLCMQSKQDAERIKALGAGDDRVSVKGNCKFDEPIPVPSAEERLEIRRHFAFPVDVPVFVAGSTNPGEDQPVIDALVLARKRHPELRMIMAPRQIERAAEIAAMATAAGFKVGRRSQAEDLKGDEDVVVLDTFGELATVYSIASAAFVGGTLIKKGGHNILQPIAHGKPVYVGPYTFKCRDLVRAAMEARVAFEVADGQELGEEIATALGDSNWLHEIEQKAHVLMTENKGASKRCAQVIVDLTLGNAWK